LINGGCKGGTKSGITSTDNDHVIFTHGFSSP
jgi:hypothetical protein